jgi:CHAT domain-containing protein
LTRAFLSSGSSSVLSTLWQANDRRTSQFMNEFYRALQHADEVAALRKAQIAFIHSGDLNNQPFFWAPFILMGSKK